ncbi:hypothetical protein SDC9_168320 [bioreactor metagenome]|uniref:Uncharacterized protein n=1 Tax=bioreactor metagenome TaxID=1076179 RepID=A0A645G283_9ZZZZ
MAVIETTVDGGIIRGELRIAGTDETPDLTADRTAFGGQEKRIVPGPRQWRRDAALDVVQKDPVFAAGVETAVAPDLRQLAGIEVQPELLQRLKPDHLDIEVVVRVQDLRPQGIAGDPVVLLVVLERRSDDAAQRLAEPAGQHLVVINFVVQYVHINSFLP